MVLRDQEAKALWLQFFAVAANKTIEHGREIGTTAKDCALFADAALQEYQDRTRIL